MIACMLAGNLTVPLEDLQGGTQQAQAHVLFHSILVQRLQGHQQHVLCCASIILRTASALASRPTLSCAFSLHSLWCSMAPHTQQGQFSGPAN